MNDPLDELNPCPLFGGLQAYAPPRALAPVDLFLDSNEGLVPSPDLLDQVPELGVELLRRYPHAGPLEAALAESVGVEPQQVLVTAGADDAIERLLRVFLAPGRNLVVPVPTFEMIPRYAELAGADIRQVPWLDGPLPVEELLQAVTPETTVLAVVSPSSPAGLAVRPDDLRRLAAGAPRALLMVDLAYGEFADEDLTSVALSLPRAVVLRSFSKAWGLAGLRVGWAAGPRRVIDWMRAAGHPYAVSSLSLALAHYQLRTGKDSMRGFVERVRRQRTELAALIRDLGGETWDSQGNFQLARFRDAAWVRDALAGLGIAVRLFQGKTYLERCLRITVPGDDEAGGRLFHGLKTVLRPQALVVSLESLAGDESQQRSWATCLERISQRLVVVGLVREEDEQVSAVVRGWRRDDGSPVVTHLLSGEESRVQSALLQLEQKLGVSRSWLVTGREELIREARAMGVLPLGVAAAGEGSEQGEALLRAGAGRVVRSVVEGEELVP